MDDQERRRIREEMERRAGGVEFSPGAEAFLRRERSREQMLSVLERMESERRPGRERGAADASPVVPPGGQ